MVESEEARGGRGKEGRHQSYLFYADDDMVMSSNPIWLQGAFNTLVRLFDRVGLKTNVGKTVGMVCCPLQAAGTQLEAEYGRRMTVAVLPTGRGIGVGYSAQSMGRRWYSGSLQATCRRSMGRKRVGDGVGKPRTPVGIHVPIGWLS